MAIFVNYSYEDSMKTIFFMIVMVSAFPVVACQSGQILTGRNGAHFCLSEMKMNWWSAHQWCQAQGYVLAHLNRVCAPYTENSQTYVWQDGSCRNLDGYDYGTRIWMNTGYPKSPIEYILMLDLSQGSTRLGSYIRNGEAGRALCDMGD